MRKSAAELEAGRKAREERERKGRQEAIARYNAVDSGPVASYRDDTGSPGVIVTDTSPWHAAHTQDAAQPTP